MDPVKLREFITIELKLARTLLQLADPGMGDPADPDGEARVIEHAYDALEMVKKFIPKAGLPQGEREYYVEELTRLERELQLCRTEKPRLNTLRSGRS